jgi:hypothetical protein
MAVTQSREEVLSMGKFLAVVGGFVAGFIVGWCTALLGYLAATNIFGFFDRDGGGAMATAFVIGPFLGIIIGVVGAILVALRMRRKSAPGAGSNQQF